MDGRIIAESIALRKAHYCRFIDTQRWTELEALLHPAPKLAFFDPTGKRTAAFSSAAEFVAATRGFLEGARTIHQVHNAEITVTDDHEATAVWSMEDYIVFSAEDVLRRRTMHGYGHYHETWRLEGDAWVITQLDLRRTILEMQERAS